jgi:hypothetical protein
MRRRKLLMALAIVLTTIGTLTVIGISQLWPEGPGVTLNNYRRVRHGMNRAQVEAILGPPGDHRTGATKIRYTPSSISDISTVTWCGDAVGITVHFVGDEVVRSEHYAAEYIPGLFDKLLGWLEGLRDQ